MDYNITYRQKDGGWQYIISYKDQNGKWRQKSKQGFKGQREAKRAADKRLEELKKQFEMSLSTEYESITFGEFSKMFLNHVALYKEGNTAIGYRTAFRKFKDLNDIELAKITSLHVQNCIDKMVKEGIKPSTIKVYTKKLSTLFSNAIKPHKIITENPVTGITIPENKDNEKVKALTKSQLDNLLDSIKNPKHYIVSLIAAKAGLRIGEILGLTRKDINFKKGIIRINKQWKIRKDGTWGFGPVKRKKSNREVPAPPSLLEALKEYIKNTPASIDGRIIPYADTQSIANLLRAHYKKAGFNISIHDLRHTFATLLLSEGVDFETVAKLLGHDVEQTIRTYSHVTSDMMNRVKKIVNKIFN
ncbi:site-specific integrase [Biomaibacter acetigenes]|uniref:Site-specific integrase n=1 Tax=Biomaibacter acetigenes TaxID=2316383 RepID=A0A3G2R5S6_9FIRM|nr:site-specific integrase [Biomaibacter acetigenes]AYO30217.1 site-specific integrase [Biomaibacter acetigenes]